MFSSNLNVSLDFVSGNIEILWKQNSLFPSGPVIGRVFTLLVVSLNIPGGVLFADYVERLKNDRCFHK